MEDEEEYQLGTEKIIPIEEHTLLFYGKPLIAVKASRRTARCLYPFTL